MNPIVIVGAGIVGLSLAALLVKNNFSVSIIECKKPELHWDKNDLTARVSAIHATSIKLLSHLDLTEIMTHSAPLCEMEIWDHTQSARVHFDSRDVDERQMGLIAENRLIIKLLWEKLMGDERVEIVCPMSPADFHFEKSQLVIGADGANSWVRQQMPITTQEKSYQQKAIIAVIESEKPHHNKAIQKFLTTGPVALLPLQNANHTALVWSADNAVSDAFMLQSDALFSDSLTKALDHQLGQLKIISSRSQFALTMRHADDYVSENYALVGDAAHSIHPLAGLGVNLGLMDAACLAQTLSDARDNRKSLTSLRTLRRYARWRRADNATVIFTMRALQQFFAMDSQSMNMIRSIGVNWVDHCMPLKNKLMRCAMGKSNDLPIFLQN